MRLFLIRHAHAVDAHEDPVRPLSRRGLGQVRALARFLRGTGEFDPTEIGHSSLARSQETAARLARRLKLGVPLAVSDDLRPEADPRKAARRVVAAASDVLAVVGHEPHLSALASLLLAGRPAPPMVAMKKAAVLALERTGRDWQVRWHWHPGLDA